MSDEEEEDSGETFKTFMKKIGAKKCTWIVSNLLEFYQTNEKIVSPELKVNTGSGMESFHLELDMIQPDPQCGNFTYKFFLVKNDGDPVKVRSFVDERSSIFVSSQSNTTAFKIGKTDRKQMWQGFYPRQHKELTFNLQLSIFEIAHQ